VVQFVEPNYQQLEDFDTGGKDLLGFNGGFKIKPKEKVGSFRIQ
jgi:hypothetical protein